MFVYCTFSNIDPKNKVDNTEMFTEKRLSDALCVKTQAQLKNRILDSKKDFCLLTVLHMDGRNLSTLALRADIL